ncbi:DUF4244 domain-containing protein [Amycolatopsis thermophila]|uniref:DUF4244 domain-containing protein n=1 Tax=Amycolatopsis thermophila TaxID=206084 RepID=A0ABU0ETV2_9PSEU|nr:DUF4244 domain-containing protein [Amycolatopsis thermophila]MDQ0378717.1 hypothetical protein [Amycolatopsis thermophila]
MLFRTKPAGRHAAPPRPRWWRRWLRPVITADDGMSTAEYAIGTIAAAAFAALLYSVVTGDSVLAALTGLIQQALTASF